MDGLVRDLEVGENLFVEIVLTFEQRLQAAEEHAGLGALDDAMVVGAGDRHDLAEAEQRAQLFGGAVVFGRVVDGAGGDDGALAGHEARDRSERADGAGVGERDGGAFEIGERKFVGAGACDDVVESFDVLREVELAGVLDVGDFERAGAVFARDVDRDSDVDLASRTTRKPSPRVSA